MTNPIAGKRPAQAAEYIGVKRGMLYQLIESDPDFPRPVRLSKRCVIFPTKLLDEYLDKKAKQAVEL